MKPVKILPAIIVAAFAISFVYVYAASLQLPVSVVETPKEGIYNLEKWASEIPQPISGTATAEAGGQITAVGVSVYDVQTREYWDALNGWVADPVWNAV